MADGAVSGVKRTAEEQLTKENSKNEDLDHASSEDKRWEPAAAEEMEKRRIVAAPRKDSDEGVREEKQPSTFAAESVLSSAGKSVRSTFPSLFGSSTGLNLDYSSTPSLFGTLSSMPSSSIGSSTSANPFPISSTSSLFGASTLPPFNMDFNPSALFGTNSASTTSSLPSKFTLSIPSSCQSSPIFGINIAAPLKTEEPTPIAPIAESTPVAVPEVQKIDVVTGEEDEQRVHSVRAKLLELDGSIWKERGSGQVHINTSRTSSLSRIVMRSEAILKLILNVPIFPSMACERVQEKGVRISPLGEGGKPAFYLLRVARKEEANSLFEVLEQCKKTGANHAARTVSSTGRTSQKNEMHGKAAKETPPPVVSEERSQQQDEIPPSQGEEPAKITKAVQTATPVAQLILTEIAKFEANEAP